MSHDGATILESLAFPAAPEAQIPSPAPVPTVWGLNPTQLHDRFWACRGVQIVRQGEPSQIVAGADLFLLTDPRLMTMFSLSPLLQLLRWDKADLICVRLHDRRDHAYRERIVAKSDGL